MPDSGLGVKKKDCNKVASFLSFFLAVRLQWKAFACLNCECVSRCFIRFRRDTDKLDNVHRLRHFPHFLSLNSSTVSFGMFLCNDVVSNLSL